MVEETPHSGESISVIVKRQGVAPDLLYGLRWLMNEGGAEVQADDDVTDNGDARWLEKRIREIERQLGRKTLEVEILKCETNRAFGEAA